MSYEIIVLCEDMLHPNQVAINYIWERLVDTTISAQGNDDRGRFTKIAATSIFNPRSDSHQKFEAKLQAKIAKWFCSIHL
jgi:hypothetical protein